MENVDNSWQQQTRVICFFSEVYTCKERECRNSGQTEWRTDGRTDRKTSRGVNRKDAVLIKRISNNIN